MTRGTITNWALCGTGLMLIINPLNRIALAPLLEQHAGSTAGAMVLCADAPYGLLLAAAVGAYSIVIKSAEPFLGIVIAGGIYIPAQLVLALLCVLLLACFDKEVVELYQFSFAQGVVLVLLGCIWHRPKWLHKKGTDRQQHARQVSSESAPSASPDEPSA